MMPMFPRERHLIDHAARTDGRPAFCMTRQLEWRVLRPGIAGLCLMLASASAWAASALAEYGQPKYPPGFTHFDYADPNAPGDGSLSAPNYDDRRSYDSLNPFLARGNPAPDIENLMFDTLLQRSWDEPASAYALIADDVEIAPDRRSAVFHINPAARFNDGEPITATDVAYSLAMLKGPQASPQFSAEFSVIADAHVLDPHTIRFDFVRPDRSAPLIVGDLPVFSSAWAGNVTGAPASFDVTANRPPVSSGAYLIETRKDDHQITYVRNPDYWAANLPTRRGMFRFRHITFKLFDDMYVQVEGFKAGAVDFNIEGSAAQWARKYVGPKFTQGHLHRATFPDSPANLLALVINTRQKRFADPRVRHALALAYDYEWMNRLLFYGQYRRNQSYFDASPFAATGLPDADQRALLDPWRAVVPPNVFGPMPQQPSTSPPHSLRDNLRQARDLLAQAGWHYRDGALRDAAGQAMTLEILDDSSGGMDRIYLPYLQILARLGIRGSYRSVDTALYVKRLDHFDFDLTTNLYRAPTVPGIELLRRFGSAAALQPGSENYPGVSTPAVDALIDAVLRATTLEQLEAATRALDRVLICSWYVVPQYYLPAMRIAYDDRLGHPAVTPTSYREADWPIEYWYVRR